MDVAVIARILSSIDYRNERPCNMDMKQIIEFEFTCII